MQWNIIATGANDTCLYHKDKLLVNFQCIDHILLRNK